MKKLLHGYFIFVFAVLAALIFSSHVLATTPSSAEDILPGNALFTLEIQMNEGMQPIVNNILETIIGDIDLSSLSKVLVTDFKNKERLFFAFYGARLGDPNAISALVFPIDESDFQQITNGLTATMINSQPYYHLKESDSYIARFSNLALILKNIKDLSAFLRNRSVLLREDIRYKAFNIKIGNRIAAFFINTEKLILPENYQMLIDGRYEHLTYYGSLAKIFDYQGTVLKETQPGVYEIMIIAEANPAKAIANDFSLNPGGQFTPTLFNFFPIYETLFYFEANDFKAFWEKFFKPLISYSQFGLDDITDIENEPLGKTNIFTFKSLFNIVTQEYGFAVQRIQDEKFPIITFMGKIENLDAAKLVIEELHNTIGIDEEKSLKYESVIIGGIPGHHYNIEYPEEIALSSEFHFYFGVTNDRIMYFSTDPNFPASYGQGLLQNHDFSSAYRRETFTTPVTAMMFLNVRSLWDSMEDVFKFYWKIGNAFVSLDFLNNYLNIEKYFYPIKYLFGYSKGDMANSSTVFRITTDDAIFSNDTFRMLIEAIINHDSDSDGLSDFEELYKYNTRSTNADSDNDSRSDSVEIIENTNPYSYGYGFNDVPEKTWYTRDVLTLKRQNVAHGICRENRSALSSGCFFEPGKAITRCEFVTMILEAYRNSVPIFVENSQIPFKDLQMENWCTVYAYAAHRDGILAGNPDGTFSGDSTILRAEAAQIISRASQRLKFSMQKGLYEIESLPFIDIQRDAWYLSAVANVYRNKVMLGQSKFRFAPESFLTKAEAAVLIKRAVDQDNEYLAKGLRSLNEMILPIVEPILKRYLPEI